MQGKKIPLGDIRLLSKLIPSSIDINQSYFDTKAIICVPSGLRPHLFRPPLLSFLQCYIFLYSVFVLLLEPGVETIFDDAFIVVLVVSHGRRFEVLLEDLGSLFV